MLILFTIWPALSALSPGNRSRPQTEAEPLRKFQNLFQKCEELKNFLPLSAATAEIRVPDWKSTNFSIYKSRLDLRNGKTEELTQQHNLLPAVWDHNVTRFGYYTGDFEQKNVFMWNDDEKELDLGTTFGIEYGFATEDYVYSQVLHEDGVKKFARWKVDLSGTVELLGDASPNGSWLFFQYELGPTYYLTDDKCLQIDDLKQLSEGYQIFRECDTHQGMFAFSDLYEWYSLSAFAWLTRECNGQIWSDHKAHDYVKIRFLPDDPPAIQRTTTTTIYAPTTQPLCTDLTNFYAIVFSGLAIILVSIGIGNGIFFVHMRKKLRKAKLQVEPLHRNKKTKSPRKTTTSTTTAADSSTTKISRMATMSSLSSEGLPKDDVTKLLLSPEIERIFDQNEVEGIEAELPYTPLERQPEPQEGFFCAIGKIGVTIPAKTFDKTFGEFEMEMGGELCTVQFEDVESELNRIEAMAAVMRQAQKKQINGTIPEFMVTAQLDAFNFRLMVAKKIGPSIEKQVLNGTLSMEEKLTLVSLTFNCMEDLLFSNIIHRDIKPSSFRYDFVGSKLLISNLGLARITPKSPRLKVPFFGNLTFCSPSTHLNLERTHFDDMVSYFYVVLWIFNKDLLLWSSETDKTVVYQLKSDMLEGNLLEERLEKFIEDQKLKDFLRQLFRLIVKLPPKRPSYRKIKQLIEKNT